MNRKRWMILAVCMLVLLSLAACGKADGGDDSGAAALESVLRQVRDKLDEAKHDEAESGSTADDSEPEPEKRRNRHRNRRLLQSRSRRRLKKLS